MPFVKLDCGILDSSLWLDASARNLFITALLMAVPGELKEDTPELCVRSLEETGWEVPTGWYGFVAAAGPGIIRRCGLSDEEGYEALVRLASPDPQSRSDAFEGRRMVRVDGGYVILNFIAYRDRDYTAAARQKRFRDRHKQPAVTPLPSDRNAVTLRNITHAEAEAEAKADPKRLIDERSSINRSGERELMTALAQALGTSEMAASGGHWRANWVRPFPGLVRRALADLAEQRKRGLTPDNPAAWLTDLLKRWQ